MISINAIIGEKSIIPVDGNLDLIGERIGSVIMERICIIGLFWLIPNNEINTLAVMAIIKRVAKALINETIIIDWYLSS